MAVSKILMMELVMIHDGAGEIVDPAPVVPTVGVN
jgi:hypothetical protein